MSRLTSRLLPILAVLAFVVALAPAALAEAPDTAVAAPSSLDGDLCPAPLFLAEQQPIDPKPVQLECKYTCNKGTIDWILICSDSEATCCRAADAACPELEPPSTGTATCSCTPTGR